MTDRERNELVRRLEQAKTPDEFASALSELDPEVARTVVSELAREGRLMPRLLGDQADVQITDEDLVEYVAGRANPVMCEVIEDAMDWQLGLREVVASLRSEYAHMSAYGVEPVGPTERKRGGIFSLSWFRLSVEAGVAMAAAVVLFALLRVGSSPGESGADLLARLEAAETKNGELAQGLKDSADRMNEIRRELDATQGRAGQAESELEAARQSLEEEKSRSDSLAKRLAGAGNSSGGTRTRSVRDGDRVIYEIDGGFAESLPSNDPAADALKKGRIEAGRSNEDLKQAARDDAPFDLISPIVTSVRAEDIVFRWQPFAKSATYVVTVYANGRIIAESGPIAGTSWRPDGGTLPQGEVFTWSVRAFVEGRSAESSHCGKVAATFRTLSPQEESALRSRLDEAHGSLLGKASAFAEFGMTEAALEALREFARLNPRSEAAAEMLRDFEARRKKELELQP
ncbi:MAG: hypothetical protein AKCLJLPJ_00977 [Fimbriimonadales bacterium]|nr:hypothetical protein [Fimbriimonadales bacterium]